ncbi:MAG: hypothetical protein Q7S61_00185 [bacterium]|nr:hypothetical protein [bacterium]
MNFRRNTIIVTFLFALLVYSRFVNLSWGLPYPFHPDERNMAIAIQQLHCVLLPSYNAFIHECFNPHFFAYGQLPLYLGYGIVQLYHYITNSAVSIRFEEAIIGIRILSAIASVINWVVCMSIVAHIYLKKEENESMSSSIWKLPLPVLLSSGLIFLYSPFFIQLAHFGTTESLLMLFSSLLVLYAIRYLKWGLSLRRYMALSGIVGGMAIATKISSLIFLSVPVLLIVLHIAKEENKRFSARAFFSAVKFILLCAWIGFLFSPHNLISFSEFLGSMRYEGDVATGIFVFYTRQFFDTLPIVFQFVHVFPYVLGVGIFGFFLLGFIFLPYKKEYSVLRIVFLMIAIPNAFLYAKWTRFMAPVLPLMLVMAVLFIVLHIKQKVFLFIATLLLILPGLGYLSIYTQEDVRFTASRWIYSHIPENAYVLSETANVVDIPMSIPEETIPLKPYKVISFNFYDLDDNKGLQNELAKHIEQADYIFVPSRRIFANHYCEPKLEVLDLQDPTSPRGLGATIGAGKEKCQKLREKYPMLNDYYLKLFSGQLGFEKVAEFTSYPKIELFGKTLLEFPDEQAEETWTVFDHPVIRIYKRLHN